MDFLFQRLSEGSSSSSLICGHSSSTHGYRYDIFLSFRGLDTRHSFTDYLYEALIEANITAFLDDEEIETGEDLKPELENAIKASRASIIVLSKNYASSTWCLDELVLILEQRMTSNHIVIPIFYHVEPTHVRKQQSSYGDAMAKHKQKMDEETDANKRSQWAQKMERWHRILTQVSHLKGKNVNGRLEKEFIKEIVNDIHGRIDVPLRIAQPLLIGMESSIKFINSWLKDGSSHTADILTISGMGGIGKTSLAKYVYGLHCREFDTSSYIEDIGRRCDGKYNGLLDIQKQLCHDISKTSSIQVYDVSKYTTMIENTLARKRVFLVVDDIDSSDQLDALLGSKGFHPGSKVIITTKDSWLTESCALFKTNIKPKHAMHFLEGLHVIESLQLLCLHAFMCNQPKAGYEEVSYKLVKYCQGHPLALKVLGKSLHNRDVAYWEGCIEGLKKEISSPINNVLKMSFDSLPSNNDKDLFKHISCFFVGVDKDLTETILRACGINTRCGITNLIDRFLLSIGKNNELEMHQLLQQMGRWEVHQESPDNPWKRSRLWCHEESFKVLKQKKGKGNLVGLALDMRMLEKQNLCATFQTEALSNMDNLMLLQLNYVQMNGSYENFPEEIRWLCMHGFHLNSIPLDLPMENLVALDMSYSNIESFFNCYSNPQRHEKRQNLDASCLKDKRLLGSLKILNLSFCKQLRMLGGFDELPALERLIVRNCIVLLEVCDSIKQCVELVLIDMSNCNKLEKFPRNISMLKKVKTMLLDGCNLGESRVENRDTDLREMCKANNIGINTRASSSAFPGGIPCDLKAFAISLPRSLVSLSLANNNLSTESFPMDFSCLSMLKELFLNGNPIISLPTCVRTLPRLEILSMEGCKKLKSIEHPPPTLRKLVLYPHRNHSIEKIVFDPEMSPLRVLFHLRGFERGSYEIEGMVKIQPIVGVDKKVLRRLGWTKLDFLNERHLGTNSLDSEMQMFYQFGIFSTMYEVDEMPIWFRHRNAGRSITFTIPSSSPNNLLTGLNFCSVHTPIPNDPFLGFQYFVETSRFHDCQFPRSPMIKISNVTKKRMWSYERYPDRPFGGPKCCMLLSHWMFGMNEMEAGDQVTITVTDSRNNERVKECGVSFVYDDGENNEEEAEEEEEEDVLGYYKSWNHIIGGDLSPFKNPFQTTGEYVLRHRRFFQPGRIGEELWFRAFSQRKPDIIGDARKVSTNVKKSKNVNRKSQRAKNAKLLEDRNQMVKYFRLRAKSVKVLKFHMSGTKSVKSAKVGPHILKFLNRTL
ncbi:unnamed protein product [Lactuca saligna]|uniref:ADP-ribosyl cyclase/cyclic ADP-ribose hydrolase n=1 Tax=Lactuca saligna TaxID=75948 RepID=A0AA35VW74_LACSI|nr:unnamed protein product [Lactuca saligna]